MLGAMLGWMFETLWHALLGLVLLSGFFVGGVVILSRGLATNTAHNQARCQCWDCKDRRVRALERFQEKKRNEQPRNPFPPGNLQLWMSTLDLIPDHVVQIKQEEWVVLDVLYSFEKRIHTVRLKNVKDKRTSVVTVRKANEHNKMWRRVRPWEI